MAVEGSVCARQEIESFLANQRVRSKGDRSDGRETRGEKFSSPDGKAAETSIRANALQIARRLVHRNLQQGQQ